MSNYSISLDNFGGPLDFLLYLIRKSEVDIYDIPIARITCQYLAHLEQVNELPIEEASEFMAMAATLLEIKAKALVPHHSLNGEGEEDYEDPRATLVSQLLAYRTYKEASFHLIELQKQNFDRVGRPEGIIWDYVDEDEKRKRPYNVKLNELFGTYLRLIPRIEHFERKQKSHLIEQEIPIDSYIQWVIELKPVQLNFIALFKLIHQKISHHYDLRKSILGLFLALLELGKQAKICLVQEGEYGDVTASIWVSVIEEPAPLSLA